MNNRIVLYFALFLTNLIFIFPRIVTAFLTFQPILLLRYLCLLLFVSLLPTILGKKNSKSISLLPIGLLVLVIVLTVSEVPLRALTSEKISAPKVSREVFLEVEIDSLEEYKNLDFCFPVLVPNYMPLHKNNPKYTSTLYEATEMEDAVSNLSENCSYQITEINYSPVLDMVQIPNNYDFEFRKGFEDLGKLRQKIITEGKLFSIDGEKAYLIDSDRTDSVLYPGFYPSAGIHYKLLLVEKSESMVLIFYRSALDDNGGYEYAEIVRMVQSMVAI